MTENTAVSRFGASSGTVEIPGRLYAVAVWLVRVIVRLFFRLEVIGQENIPDGPFLVASNHLSWTDTAFIAAVLPRRPAIRTMANRGTVFNTRFKRWLMPRLGVFAVDRQRGFLDEQAIDTVYRLLDAGERVLIFPEGAYGRDGQLRPLKDGIGYFALNSGQPILPISLTGTGRLRPFSRVQVVIGKPFIPEVPARWGVKRGVRAIVDSLQKRMSALGLRRHRPGDELSPGAGRAPGDRSNSP